MLYSMYELITLLLLLLLLLLLIIIIIIIIIISVPTQLVLVVCRLSFVHVSLV